MSIAIDFNLRVWYILVSIILCKAEIKIFDIDTKFKYLIVGIITFLMVFLGVVAGVSFNKLIKEKNNLPENLKGERNMLLILLDDTKQNAEELYAVNINSKADSIKIVSISKSVSINVNDEEKSFNRAYIENKTDDIKNYLEKELNVKFNNFICIDKEFLEKLCGVIGDVSVPENIELSFIKDAFLKLCGRDLSKNEADILMNIIKSVKCDIAIYDFEEYVKIFSNMGKDNITSKEVKGSYEYKEGEMFFYIEDKNIFE